MAGRVEGFARMGKEGTESGRSEAPPPTAPRMVSVFKTAVFKLHNPSQHKRAMLRDAMKRAHVCFGKLLERNLPDANELERLRALTKKERRSEFLKLKSRLEKDAFKWPHLSGGGKSAIANEAMAAIASYVELGQVQESAGVPTVTRINALQIEHEAALDQFRLAFDLKDENELRDEIARVTRAGTVRPLGFARLRYSSGFLLLRHPESKRVFAWLNLHPQKNSRFASQQAVGEMINLQTGELMSFKSKTGALFPLELGHSFHDLGFIQRGRPQSARLVWREQDAEDGGCFELHVAFQWQTLAVETERWLGVDRGIYNLAAYSVVDNDGNVIHEGSVSGRDLRFVQRQFERRAAAQQQRGHVVRGGKRAAWARGRSRHDERHCKSRRGAWCAGGA